MEKKIIIFFAAVIITAAIAGFIAGDSMNHHLVKPGTVEYDALGHQYEPRASAPAGTKSFPLRGEIDAGSEVIIFDLTPDEFRGLGPDYKETIRYAFRCFNGSIRDVADFYKIGHTGLRVK